MYLATKVLTGDNIFYVTYWRRDRYITWSSEPREGLAACNAKGVPSFPSYFKTLSNGPAPGIGPATFLSAVIKRSTELILPREGSGLHPTGLQLNGKKNWNKKGTISWKVVSEDTFHAGWDLKNKLPSSTQISQQHAWLTKSKIEPQF